MKVRSIISMVIITSILVTAVSACGSQKQINKYNYKMNLTKDENGMVQEYYTNADKRTNYKNAAYDYSSNERATENYTELYNRSTRIECYPVYGSYLEPTSLAVYIFYKNDELIGTKTLETAGLYEFDEIIKTLEKDKDSSGSEVEIVEPLSDKGCYNSLKTCMEYCPDFQIEGFIYNDLSGYKGIYLVGHNKGSEFVQYVVGAEIQDFRMIDKCKTINEVGEAFNDYFEKRDLTVSALPIYSDTSNNDEIIDSEDLLNMFLSVRKYLIRAHTITGKIEYSELSEAMEYAIEIPLLDQDRKSNRYVMYLLYQHNNLIAEFIITPEDASGVDVGDPLFERIAEKNKQSNIYDPLVTSTYGKVVTDFASRNNGKNPDIVYFDGKNISVG